MVHPPTSEAPRQHKEPEKERRTDVPVPSTIRIVPTEPVHVHHYYPAKQPDVETTPAREKELTPVGKVEPEKINEKLTNPPQNVNFSPTRPLKKMPQKMKFKGKPGRQRTEAQVEELLAFAQARNGVFPNGISDQMQRYYRREYPEYFRKGKTGKKKVYAKRSEPINISARRSGTNA